MSWWGTTSSSAASGTCIEPRCAFPQRHLDTRARQPSTPRRSRWVGSWVLGVGGRCRRPAYPLHLGGRLLWQVRVCSRGAGPVLSPRTCIAAATCRARRGRRRHLKRIPMAAAQTCSPSGSSEIPLRRAATMETGGRAMGRPEAHAWKSEAHAFCGCWRERVTEGGFGCQRHAEARLLRPGPAYPRSSAPTLRTLPPTTILQLPRHVWAAGALRPPTVRRPAALGWHRLSRVLCYTHCCGVLSCQ